MSDPSRVDILLVEDDPHDAELAILALAKSQPANGVHLVADGEAALHYLMAAHPPDSSPRLPRLVLLDLKIPKLNGFEVLRQIRATPHSSALAVVIWTSSGEERDIVQAYQLGANSYVQKPMEFGRFCSTIAQLASYWLGINRDPQKYTLPAESVGITK